MSARGFGSYCEGALDRDISSDMVIRNVGRGPGTGREGNQGGGECCEEGVVWGVGVCYPGGFTPALQLLAAPSLASS